MPLSTDTVLSIGGLWRVETGEFCLLRVGKTIVKSSSLVKLGSSEPNVLPSLLVGLELVDDLGDETASFGDGKTGLGEEYFLPGLTTGLSVSSFLRAAEPTADRARLATVS